MRISNSVRYAFGICAAVAILASCSNGASTPIGSSPGVVPNSLGSWSGVTASLPGLTPGSPGTIPGSRAKHRAKHKDLIACTNVTTSGSQNYTVAQVGGGSQLDVESSAYDNCDIGIYISAADGPASLNQTVVNGVFEIGVYLDGAGTMINHTSICVNGTNKNGNCESGSSSSAGTGIDAQNAPDLSVNQTNIDGYAAGLATSPCPNNANDLSVNQSTVTNSTYPWSFQGGKIKTNHDSPTPPSGGSCEGSGIGPGAPVLFAGNGYFNGGLIAYAPPFSNSSSPTLIITNSASINAYGAAFDSTGNLYVSNDAAPPNANVSIYTPPFSNSSTPTTTVTNGLNSPAGLALDSAGNLYVANPDTNQGINEVLIYKPPFSASSSPSVTISNGLYQPSHLAFDAAGNLYVSNAAGNKVTIFNPPFNNSSSPSVTITNGMDIPGQMVFDSAGNLYVAEVDSNAVEIYVPPLSNSSSPSVSITNGLSNPGGATLDSAGNLYVANEGNPFPTPTITVYAPPFSGSSSPIATITNGIGLIAELTFEGAPGPNFIRRHHHKAKTK